MPLTVLGTHDVQTLLMSLTSDEVRKLQESLGEALKEYSVGNQNSGSSSGHQPKGVTIPRKNGSTTVFLPASTGSSLGIKILSVADTPSKTGSEREPRHQRRFSASEYSMPVPISLDSKEDIAPLTSEVGKASLAPSQNNTTRRTQSRPPNSRGQSRSDQDTGAITPPGSLTLLDRTGSPFGLINAQEFTPFRTALTSLMLFHRREKVSTITVFGAGRQAYWHIRLALLLRYHDVKRVNIINRSFQRATELVRKLSGADHEGWRMHVKFSALSREFEEYDRLLQECLSKSDVIFCCTPSLEPLFPAEMLTDSDARRKGRFISAIGSYRPDMVELDPEFITHTLKPSRHHHLRHPPHGGVVVVDSLETCIKSAGEIIMAELKSRQLVEVGELLMLKDVEKGGHSPDKKLVKWLSKGNVIYKCVGLQLIDLVVGGDIIRLARERRVGTTLPEF